MTRQRVKVGLFGGGVFLAGLLVGALVTGVLPAFAANRAASTKHTSAPKASNYCQLYENTLAKELGVSNSTLEKDNQQAIETTLNQMQKDGKITAFEKTQIEQQLQSIGNQPCTNLGKINQQALMQSVGPLAMSAHTALVAAVAPTLKLSTATLENDLNAGQTVAKLAKAQNVSLSAVSAAYLKAVQTQTAQFVKGGYITQDQANALDGAAQKAASQGKFPLLDGGLGAAMKQGQ